MTVWKHRSSERLKQEVDQLLQAGDVKSAARILQHLVERHPRDPHLIALLGALRGMAGNFEGAARLLAKAIELNPENPGQHYNLGLALYKLGQRSKAADAFRQSIMRAPAVAEPHGELARVLEDEGQLDAAIAEYGEAARLAPDSLWASELFQCRRKACSWEGLLEQEHAIVGTITERQKPLNPLSLLYLSDDPRAQMVNAAAYFRDYQLGHAPKVSSAADRHHAKSTRLRIGYLSADFRNHPTTHLVTELIELHDRSQFDVFGYSYGTDDRSAARRRIKAAFDKFVDCSGTDVEIAQVIKRDRIDILIDLQGYTRNARMAILAHRPAPVQIHYLAYPGTLMCPWIDYLIVDPFVVPPEAEQFYGEALCFMPHSYQVNDSKRAIPSGTLDRSSFGLGTDAFVMAAFHNPLKLTPAMFDLWLDIMRKVPASVLWVQFAHEVTLSNLRAYATGRGISPDRLVGAARVDNSAHLERLSLADLFLDALPYNAHTTASEALWVGVPVVTCAGRSFASRVAASLLITQGLSDLVTTSFDQYRDLVVKIAVNEGLVAQLKQRVVAARSERPLFDTKGFCRAFEAAIEEMWQRHVRGELPSRLQL